MSWPVTGLTSRSRSISPPTRFHWNGVPGPVPRVYTFWLCRSPVSPSWRGADGGGGRGGGGGGGAGGAGGAVRGGWTLGGGPGGFPTPSPLPRGGGGGSRGKRGNPAGGRPGAGEAARPGGPPPLRRRPAGVQGRHRRPRGGHRLLLLLLRLLL